MSFLLSAFGDIYAGEAQANASAANAEQQRIQGMQQRNIGISKAAQQSDDILRQKGAITAAYGAAGVTPAGGTPLDVMADHATHAEMARQSMLWQGLTEQQSSDQQADFDRAQSKAQRTAGYISALGDIASGAEQAALKSGKA